MDKLDFTEGMKILYSCYHKDLSNDDFLIWYEMLKEMKPDIFKQAIIEICKENKYMPTVHDVLEKAENLNKKYLISILNKMYESGYFKKGIVELSDEQANRNYDKAVSWIESETIPQFLKDDINEFIVGERKIINKESLKIAPPGE